MCTVLHLCHELVCDNIIMLMQIIGSLIDFRGEVLFFNNANFRAMSVAIRMQSFAQLRFNSGLEMLFSENSGEYVTF